MEGLVGAESVSNEENKPLGWRFGAMISLNAERAHTMNDWTDKINVENGNNVHKMEKDGQTQEAESSKARHLYKMKVEMRKYRRIMDRKVELVKLGCPWS